jgi:hypothetical protein
VTPLLARSPPNRYGLPNIDDPPNIEPSKRFFVSARTNKRHHHHMARDDVAQRGARMDTEEKYARSMHEEKKRRWKNKEDMVMMHTDTVSSQ